MLLTPHVLVGIAVASAVQDPVLAVPLAFALHFAGDVVPHWDFYSHTDKEQRLRGWRPIAVMADMGLGIAIGSFFTLYALWVLRSPGTALTIFMCGIASVLPDALEAPYVFMNKQPWVTKLMYSIQHRLQFQAPLPWGIISQIIVCGFSLSAIANLLK